MVFHSVYEEGALVDLLERNKQRGSESGAGNGWSRDSLVIVGFEA